ncbi:MAG: hypothetical protein WCS30_09925, partial [Selenomonadaceae bacterium]
MLTFIVIAVSLIVTDFLISNKITEITYTNLQTKVIDVANIVASTPTVIDGLDGRGDQRNLENFAQKISAGSGVRFVTIMDMNKTRKSHPDIDKIGTHYENYDADEAFRGIAKTSIDNGSLGRSLRAFAPVYTADGKQVGVVLVGVMLDEVTSAVAKARSNVIFGSICGLLIGIIGAVFLANHIKKFTFGMEPLAVAKLLEERNAILSSIGFLLGKLSLAREAGVKIQLAEDCFVPDMFNTDTVHDIITII